MIEPAGIPTVTLNMIWVYQRLVGMPRISAIEHPFGRPCGEVGDATTQRAALRAVLHIFKTASEPGHVEHLPFVWAERPDETRWHPAEPSSIIPWLKQRKKGPAPGGSSSDD